MAIKETSKFPLIMGVVNVTPDSFSDGGQFFSVEKAFKHAIHLVEAGVDIIDIGGESTRPGSYSIGVQEELDRILGILDKLSSETDIKISLDTTKPKVMAEALKYRLWMINDTNAFRTTGALECVKNTEVQLCVMHKQGEPAIMQHQPTYHDSVVQEVYDFLAERIRVCVDSGIDRTRLWIDPGFGFGKTLNQNLMLLKNMHVFKKLDAPILIGLSRKSMFGELVNQLVHQRLPACLSATLFAVQQGVDMIRTHDVRETREAVFTWQTIHQVEEYLSECCL